MNICTSWGVQGCPGVLRLTGHKLSFFLSLLVSLKLEHYSRECEFGNFDKIKNKNNTKNTKTFG